MIIIFVQATFGTPEKKAAKVDLSSLFLSRNLPMTNSEAEELMAYYNSLLKMMQCCVIEDRKFSILPRSEKGLKILRLCLPDPIGMHPRSLL